MAYTDLSYQLLVKRCNFLDSKLSWPSSIGDAHPAGKRYRHFRANGLTLINAHKATRGFEHPDSTASVNDRVHGEGSAHTLEQFAVSFEDVRDVDVPWYWVNYDGTNPFEHRANTYLGAQLRSPWAAVTARAYSRHPGLIYNNSSSHVKQLYRDFELTPADPTGDLRSELLAAAQSHPLRGQLTHRYYNQPECSVWSARYAGFPDANFYSSTATHVPNGVLYYSPSTSRSLTNYNLCLHANPTILLMTMEVPEDYDQWAADPAMNGSTITVKLHSRWVSCPHWMGYAIQTDDEYYGRSSVYRVPYKYENWPELSKYNTGIFVRGGDLNQRDLLLCNPGDRFTDDNPMPII